MRKIHILGAFIAVLAFSALAVANASATTWLKNGAELNKEETADTHGEIILHHINGLGGEVLLDCTGLFHGVVGPGPLDLVNEVLGLLSTELNLVSCKILKRGNCFTSTETLATVHAINLPWHTLLELVGGVTIDHFLPESGKEAGYEFSCPALGGLKGSCSGLDTSEFLANETGGAIFHNLGTAKQKCTDGGEGFTLGLGEVLGVSVS